MNRYFMGIDNGGTMCKAVIFNEIGEEIAGASCKLELLTPKAGFTERDMEYLWDINTKVIKKVILKSKIDPREIKGVACTGHGKGLYLWGKDGKPAYNGIVSTDSRASEYIEEWEADGTAEKVFKKSYQKILACQPATLLSWLRDNEPEVMENIKWIFEVKDYIRFRLTGEAYAEITDISGSNFLNLEIKNYDKELLELFGLEKIYAALPSLKKSTDLCGKITEAVSFKTNLPPGTPVAGGMFDIDACAIAMDITDSENICVIAGTWGINEYISKEPVLDSTIMMNSLFCLDDYYLIEESSPTSAGNLEWYINAFLSEEKKQALADGVSIYKYCDTLVSSISPEEQDITFLPYIFGSNYNPSAKACFIGMDSHHSRAYVVRAVFEGIVFSHMIHLEKLIASRGKSGKIRLAGGAAKSEIWAQMFADVTGLTVELIETEELGALGAAMAVSVAAGVYSNIKEAAGSMVKIKSVLEPDSTKYEIYRKKFGAYRKASETLEKLWSKN